MTTKEEHIIFDRCPLDMLAYLHATNGLDSTDLQSWYQKWQEVVGEIDLLVFVPIEVPDLIGCTNSELPVLREQVNEMLSEWIGDFDLEVVEVFGSVSVRANKVIARLIEMSKRPKNT
jgi:hypothetical protein